ncbi:hypothetical protein [Lysobacter rhizosphaerae]
MPSESLKPIRLEVPLADFVEGLRRTLKVIGRRNAGDALVSYADGQLCIRLGGAEMKVPALGHWPGEARVDSIWLRTFARVPPLQNPLIVQVEEGRLRIARSSVPCHWQRPGEARVEAPLGLEPRALIRLAHAHSHEELEKSGIAAAVVGARKELDKRIDAAAKQLAPFGVSPADVRLLVITKLQLA